MADMGTADQDDDTASAKAPTPERTDGHGDVADDGGDSDPAAASSGPPSEAQAEQNREEESPS